MSTTQSGVGQQKVKLIKKQIFNNYFSTLWWATMATTELYPSSSGFSLPRATWNCLCWKFKTTAKGILAYLAIRSQPDADVEDLVVVEEGEGEGAVHSAMSAVSHQKAPVLSNCKTDRRWKVAWKWDQILPTLLSWKWDQIPFLTISSAVFLSTGLYQGSPDTCKKRNDITRVSNDQIYL